MSRAPFGLPRFPRRRRPSAPAAFPVRAMRCTSSACVHQRNTMPPRTLDDKIVGSHRIIKQTAMRGSRRAMVSSKAGIGQRT
ncbi:hypothetical protein [Novosphingobium sp. Chol11]|uniref:hypothetical protein n=1 Tax=Novosphingobium sp. Chol11 TaxID=1385763 RepID=UPI0025DEF5F1|nr:hypothetical protein [Novosphingobium sp. Chol11]